MTSSFKKWFLYYQTMTPKFRSRVSTTLFFIIVSVVAAAGYFYSAWWIPNRKMDNPAWWQNASQDEMRSVSHEVLRFPVGNHHDAFLILARLGDAESVPLLVKSLKWQAAPDSTDFTLCTTEHAVDALQSLTGLNIGFEPAKWKKWWNESGVKLPPSSFYPRNIKKNEHNASPTSKTN